MNGGGGGDGNNAFAFALGLSLNLCCLLSWSLLLERRKSARYQSSYAMEKSGRTRLEKENREVVERQLQTGQGFYVNRIGTISSCYRQCLGTPRQGFLVPSSRAAIAFVGHISPEALENLDEFSHVWLTFQFHLNTNTAKEANALTGTLSSTNTQFTFTAKVTPPMVKEKKGVFATRSPHRPNAIGVTLARLESIDKKKKVIYLSSCDLVEGTPILDIKPYVHHYDSLPESRVPEWIRNTIQTKNVVDVADGVKLAVEKLQMRLKEYKNNADLFIRAVVETLEADVRSEYQTKKGIDDARINKTFYFPFDNATIYYLWVSERHMVWKSVELSKFSENVPPQPSAAIVSDDAVVVATGGSNSGDSGGSGGDGNSSSSKSDSSSSSNSSSSSLFHPS